MFNLDKVRAKTILVSELGYNSTDADLYLKDYPQLHDELREAVQRWLNDRSISDTTVYGVSIEDVMHARGSHFLMAVSAINRLFDTELSPVQRERMLDNLRQRIPRA